MLKFRSKNKSDEAISHEGAFIMEIAASIQYPACIQLDFSSQ